MAEEKILRNLGPYQVAPDYSERIDLISPRESEVDPNELTIRIGALFLTENWENYEGLSGRDIHQIGDVSTGIGLEKGQTFVVRDRVKKPIIRLSPDHKGTLNVIRGNETLALYAGDDGAIKFSSDRAGITYEKADWNEYFKQLNVTTSKGINMEAANNSYWWVNAEKKAVYGNSLNKLEFRTDGEAKFSKDVRAKNVKVEGTLTAKNIDATGTNIYLTATTDMVMECTESSMNLNSKGDIYLDSSEGYIALSGKMYDNYKRSSIVVGGRDDEQNISDIEIKSVQDTLIGADYNTYISAANGVSIVGHKYINLDTDNEDIDLTTHGENANITIHSEHGNATIAGGNKYLDGSDSITLGSGISINSQVEGVNIYADHGGIRLTGSDFGESVKGEIIIAPYEENVGIDISSPNEINIRSVTGITFKPLAGSVNISGTPHMEMTTNPDGSVTTDEWNDVILSSSDNIIVESERNVSIKATNKVFINDIDVVPKLKAIPGATPTAINDNFAWVPVEGSDGVTRYMLVANTVEALTNLVTA